MIQSMLAVLLTILVSFYLVVILAILMIICKIDTLIWNVADKESFSLSKNDQPIIPASSKFL